MAYESHPDTPTLTRVLPDYFVMVQRIGVPFGAWGYTIWTETECIGAKDWDWTQQDACDRADEMVRLLSRGE